MIDADDVGIAGAVGGLFVLVIFVIWYLVFSVPEINKCHEKGGKIVRIEGTDQCMDVGALKEIK
jgi:hypothetical protein